MKVGIKYCGGCNPRYDRGRVFRDLKKEYPEIEFEYAMEGEKYDKLLVIGGCTNNCASFEQYIVSGEVTRISDAQEIEVFTRLIRNK